MASEAFKPSGQSSSESSTPQNLVNQISQLKQTLEIVKTEKEELEKENISLNRLNKKLTKDATDLQRKHEKVCEEVKILRSDKESILKELNVKSVALASAKKELNDHKNISEARVKKFEVEIVKLQEFKEEKEAKDRKARRALKKARQKERKKSEAKISSESLNEIDFPEESPEAVSVSVKNKFEDLQSNTEFNNNCVVFEMVLDIEKEAFEKEISDENSELTVTAAKVKEDAAEEDVPIKADQVELPRTILKAKKTNPRPQKVLDTSVFDSEDVEEEARESSELESVSNISNSSGSAPLTKKDIEECLKMMSTLYKT